MICNKWKSPKLTSSYICAATKQNQPLGCTQFTGKVCNLHHNSRLHTFTVNFIPPSGWFCSVDPHMSTLIFLLLFHDFLFPSRMGSANIKPIKNSFKYNRKIYNARCSEGLKLINNTCGKLSKSYIHAKYLFLKTYHVILGNRDTFHENLQASK